MEIHVLGPVELMGAAGPVSLSADKQRRLLAALATRPGEASPAEVLIDAVWPTAQPRSAAKLLQIYVSQLRRLLEPPIAIRTCPGGYLLELDDRALDARCFEHLLDQGRAAAAERNHELAASRIGRGLAFWRGPAYGDLAYEDFALPEAERLEALRVVARDQQLAAELELGAHVELLPELLSRARAHPLRETPQAQAMVALYRCGRQVEALEIYRQLHDRLRAELGLDPGRELRELQQQVLNHDPGLAARRADRVTAPLPAPQNVLVGRDRELAELTDLLLRDEVRLLVLTGAGGSGKTRLALELARAVQQLFSNGVMLVELAMLRDPRRLSEVIARACGVEQAPGAEPLDALIGALRTRELLLVLDNFEQLRAAGPDLVALLAGAPNVTVLVTSRVVLHVSGEHVYPVQPLQLDAAVALFCARARAADPGFRPDSPAEDAIASVCTRLDRLPLAIELAAAHARVLTPAELRARIDVRLPLLTGGPRDLPARQRTLRATLEWSYDLLTASQRRLLRSLVVFAGGFELPAAEQVCAAELETLEALVDHSLVRCVEDGRFALLETVREFAAERLAASAEGISLRERHALYFRELAEMAHLREDSDGEERYDVVLQDQENLRAALTWALENGRVELGIEIAIAIESFWWTNAASEGRRWFEALVCQADDLPPRTLARALGAYATTIVFAGDLPGAEPLYRRSLEICRRLGDDRELGNALHRLAANADDRGDFATARRLIDESLEILERVGNAREQSSAVQILGKVECDEGNYDLGIESLARAASLAEQAGARFAHAYCLGELCQRAFEAGRFSDAERWGRQSIERCQKLGDRQTELFVLTLLARTALAAGRLRQAGFLWGVIEAEQQRAPLGWWTMTGNHSRYGRMPYIAPLLDQDDAEFRLGRAEGLRLPLENTISSVLTTSATQDA